MVLKNFKRNTEFNTGGIFVSSNIHTKSPLELASDKWTQVNGIRSLTNVEFVRPLTSLPTIYNTQYIYNYIILVAK